MKFLLIFISLLLLLSPKIKELFKTLKAKREAEKALQASKPKPIFNVYKEGLISASKPSTMYHNGGRRLAAVKKLARFIDEPDVQAHLLDILRREIDDDVKEAAMNILEKQ